MSMTTPVETWISAIRCGGVPFSHFRLDNRSHAGKGERQPEELGRGDLLAKEKRAEHEQHEGLRVVDRRRDRDGGMRIGGEKQQPV
jgi:hypothetical protein